MGEVSLKEHIEKVVELKIIKAEGDLNTFKDEVERRLKDLVDSRIKFITIIAVVAVIISGIALVINILK